MCGWFLEHASPLVKVTIVPRGIGTLGYAQYLPKEEYITRTEALLDRMCMTFGGRAAEKIVFGKVSTGAQSDLDQVTKMAYSMVSVFGMSDEVGQVSFYGMQNESFAKPYSDETATKIDDEVRRIVQGQYERAQALLEERTRGTQHHRAPAPRPRGDPQVGRRATHWAPALREYAAALGEHRFPSGAGHYRRGAGGGQCRHAGRAPGVGVPGGDHDSDGRRAV